MSNYRITVEELQKYHKMDRKMLARLILDMMRDPAESLLVIASWLWLEERGFQNTISKIVGISDILVRLLADEAIIFLMSLEVSTPPVALKCGIPFTSHVMDHKLSLQTFGSHETRFVAISGIRNTLQTVCSRVYTDILFYYYFRTPHAVVDHPILIPGFPHPLFGSVIISTQLKEDAVSPNIWEYTSLLSQGWNNGSLHSLELLVPDDHRTLFLTFSRGFPVSEYEVLAVFDKEYGDCVERIEMGSVSSIYDQPLYARLIMRSLMDIDIVLKGRRLTKIRVNGKHIWARRYEIRE